MLDLLLIPAVVLLCLALWTVRRGDHRLHGHLMIAGMTLIGVRLVLHPRGLSPHHRTIWLLTLAAAGITILLGRMALAWREGHSSPTAIPRIHRASGTATLIGLSLATLVWLLRNRT